VAAQEHHDLLCRQVDLEPMEPARAAVLLHRELLSGAGDPVAAYRSGRRWTRQFEPTPAELVAPGETGQIPSGLRRGGTYLVTGGLGNVGFVVSLALARLAQARLVLVGRSAVPAREEWDAWLASHPAQDPGSVRIQRIRALEAAGSEVLVGVADVADAVGMGQVIAAARSRFGDIHGVIHAAGLLGRQEFAPLAELSRATALRLFAAKVHGLLVLEDLLAGSPPELWLLVSSLSAVLGGIGYAAYAGANAYLDRAAASPREAFRRGRWMSVDFDRWQFGAQERTGPEPGDPATAITAHEGLRLLEYLLRGELSGQVVVSTTPLQDRLQRWVAPEPTAPAAPEAGAAGQARPALATPYLAPRDEREQALAAIFEELLGVRPVGAHDDFFELGGHSLFAARVLSRLRTRFGVALPLAALFESPTVAGLADRLAREAAPTSLGVRRADRVEIEI
jgi:acyl carrier protein